MDAAQDKIYLTGLFEQDRGVMKEIYQKFRPRIVAYVQKNGGTKEDGNDLFQVALEIFYFKKFEDNFVLHGTFYGFLHAICKNKWWDELKKRKQKSEIDQAARFLAADTTEENQRMWDQFSLYEEKFKLLGDNCRKILEGFYHSNLNHQQIAEQLGFSEKYSRLSKHRCLEKLKKLIMEDERFYKLKNTRKK